LSKRHTYARGGET